MSITVKDIKQNVIQIVTDKPGVKATEIPLLLSEEVRLSNCAIKLSTILEDLVKEGEIVEVEYTLTTMNYRAKSMFFPWDTCVTVIDNSIRRSIKNV